MIVVDKTILTVCILLCIWLFVIAVIIIITIPIANEESNARYTSLMSWSRKNNIPLFTSINEANKWVYGFVKYKPDTPYKDFWQSPEQALYLKTGDCDDYVNLFLKICNDQFYAKGNHVCVKIESGGNHGIAKIENEYYDPTWGSVGWNTDYGDIQDITGFEKAMRLAYNNYHK